MTQHPIEVILAKRLASHLALPIFLVDPMGNLLFYNEPAERLLGQRYEETGEMPVEQWSVVFREVDDDPPPVTPSELPLVIALEKREPTHRSLTIRGLDGVRRDIAVTALPLEGGTGRFLGAIAFFWEEPAP
ncbi:MAG: PAS domain-containing protein [Actinomycetota bacterium]|nr:PAS domain-containing protein [Actinomycetota bacterium]